MNKLIALTACTAVMFAFSAQANEAKTAEKATDMVKEKAMNTGKDLAKEGAMAAGKDPKAMESAKEAMESEAAETMKTEAKEEPAKSAMDSKTETKGKKFYTEVTSADVKKMIDEKQKFTMIDARSAEDFKAGHIEGAINVRPDEITAEKMAKIAADKSATLVFYCGGVQCPASTKAAKRAFDLGYKNIVEYSGGVAAWKESGYSLKM